MKCAIIGGGGMVGASSAFALVTRNVPVEVLLVDVVEAAAAGQALDIEDAGSDSLASCRAAKYSECGDCELIVITAGYPQKPGEPRSMLLSKNKEILKSVFSSIGKLRSDCKVLVVANPVDVLTHLAQKISGLPPCQVFGSGTWLDSCRLRNALAAELKVRPSSVQAWVLGEHGDRQFVAWSKSTVFGQPVLGLEELRNKDPEELVQTVARKAYAIIDAKRSTYFGIGKCVSDIVLSVLGDRGDVLPLTVHHPAHDTYMSWPCVLGRRGVLKVLPLQLDDRETAKLAVAVQAIKQMCAEADAL